MMRDMKTDMLFTINEIHDDLSEDQVEENKKLLTDDCFTEASNIMRPTQKITVPQNMGMTSWVYKERKMDQK